MVHTKRMLGMLGILSVLALTVGLVGCKKDKVDNTQGTVDLVGTWEIDTRNENGYGLITKSGELMWLSKRDYFEGNPHEAKNATITVDPEGKVTSTEDFFGELELKFVSHHWNDNILTVKIKMQDGTHDTVFECSFFVKDDCLYAPLLSDDKNFTDKPLTKEGKEEILKEEISDIEEKIEIANAVLSGKPSILSGKPSIHSGFLYHKYEELTKDEIDKLKAELKADADMLNKMLESSEEVYCFGDVFKKKK